MNLNLYQGDDYEAVVSVTNADGTDADLTGYTPEAQIRRQVADIDPVVVAEFDITVDSPRLLLAIGHDSTAALSGKYLWDLQLTDGAGIITTIIAGGVTVSQEVTRPGA